MRLKNDLYTVSRCDMQGMTGSFEIKLNPSCFIYKAHFPGEPVTPGVCIVQMALELMEELTGGKMEITRVKNVKFLSVISPRQTTTLTYNIKKVEVLEQTGEMSVQITVVSGDDAKAKLSFSCRKVHNT